jgi:hypothetical protein
MGTSWQELRRRAEHWVRHLLPAQDCRALVFRLLADLQARSAQPPVLVQTGCGPATPALAAIAARVGGVLYCCEPDGDRIDALRASDGSAIADVLFLRGDSLEELARIAARHERVDFALLGSAPSATHTLREFFAIEARLGPGARLLIDEAALPGARLTLRPCRKGKLLVPYLLASPVWRVAAHPRVGESMVSAVHDRVGARADASYEDPGYVDRWLAQRAGALRPIS